MSSEPVLEARGLGKAYRIFRNPQDRLREFISGRPHHEDFWALKGIDLSLAEGETLGVIGRNGAGKSTFLQLVCGTLRPSAGTLQVKGRIAAMLELGAGFNPEFSGAENVMLSGAILGLKPDQLRARFADIEAFADIGGFIDQPVKHYSSGMYARLAFAVCAHVDADILIVDEILAVGDIAFQQKCMRFLNHFRKRGTLLFVSHDSEAVVRLCDKVLWLDHGAVKGFGDAREMCRRYRVAQSQAMAEDASGFRAGGALKPIPPPPERASPKDFTFNPDAPGVARGGADIVKVSLLDPDGEVMGVAAGGEDISLHLTCRAQDALSDPVIAFVLRDRLGQALFGDETQSVYGASPPRIAKAQSFDTRFRFRLPHLASGAYAIEIFLYDGADLLAHAQDAAFLHIQSRHISTGLANLAMRGISLEKRAP